VMAPLNSNILTVSKCGIESTRSRSTPSQRTIIPCKGTLRTLSHVLGGPHNLCSRPSRPLLRRATTSSKAHTLRRRPFFSFWVNSLLCIRDFYASFLGAYSICVHHLSLFYVCPYPLPFPCHVFSWGAYTNFLFGGLSMWRTVFMCVLLFPFGLNQPLFATRWSSPFCWRS
jgi:hypothetical protein